MAKIVGFPCRSCLRFLFTPVSGHSPIKILKVLNISKLQDNFCIYLYVFHMSLIDIHEFKMTCYTIQPTKPCMHSATHVLSNTFTYCTYLVVAVFVSMADSGTEDEGVPTSLNDSSVEASLADTPQITVTHLSQAVNGRYQLGYEGLGGGGHFTNNYCSKFEFQCKNYFSLIWLLVIRLQCLEIFSCLIWCIFYPVSI